MRGMGDPPSATGRTAAGAVLGEPQGDGLCPFAWHDREGPPPRGGRAFLLVMKGRQAEGSACIDRDSRTVAGIIRKPRDHISKVLRGIEHHHADEGPQGWSRLEGFKVGP